MKTSLLSLICAAAVSTTGFAAPTVRSVGGEGTYTSAASATDPGNATAARSGSLRATGGFVRPTATTTSSLKAATTPAATTTTTTTGSTTTGTTSVGRVAASPRLSIGKYIGTPTSVSTSAPGTDFTHRLERLESDVYRLESEKQETLKDTTYITVQDDELILEVDKLKTDLDLRAGEDGREVEIGTNDIALLWRYVGDTEWTELIDWETLKSILKIDGIQQAITVLNQSVENVNADLSTKVDIFQGTDYTGKALIVDASGNVVPAGEFASSGDVYNKTEIENRFTTINADVSGKLDIHQGTEHIGHPLIINESGDVIVSENSFPTIDGLGALAFKDTISNGDVDEATLERSKMAASITDTLYWIDAWRNSMPSDGQRYVFALDENGDAGWFKVAE